MWQDLTVARAGCVRTMSLLIPATEFAAAESLAPMLDLVELDRLPEDSDAKRVMLNPAIAKSLLPAAEFEGSELLEALFLEYPQSAGANRQESAQPILCHVGSRWPRHRKRHRDGCWRTFRPDRYGGTAPYSPVAIAAPLLTVAPIRGRPARWFTDFHRKDDSMTVLILVDRHWKAFGPAP